MLDLDDPRWRELRHAFGSAEDAPRWLRAIIDDPSLSSHDMDDPFGAMNNFVWNTIVHQGDIYPASYAVVPHLVGVVARDPGGCSRHLVAVVAWIEICRQAGRGPEIPAWLQRDYSDAILRLRRVAATALADGVQPDGKHDLIFVTWVEALIASSGRGRLARAFGAFCDPAVLEGFLEEQS